MEAAATAAPNGLQYDPNHRALIAAALPKRQQLTTVNSTVRPRTTPSGTASAGAIARAVLATTAKPIFSGTSDSLKRTALKNPKMTQSGWPKAAQNAKPARSSRN